MLDDISGDEFERQTGFFRLMLSPSAPGESGVVGVPGVGEIVPPLPASTESVIHNIECN